MPARADLPKEVIFGRHEVRLYTFDDLEATGRVALKQRALNLRDMLGDDPSVPRLIPSASPEQLGVMRAASNRAASNREASNTASHHPPIPHPHPTAPQCFGCSRCSAFSRAPSGRSCLRRILARPLPASCRSPAGRSESGVGRHTLSMVGPALAVAAAATVASKEARKAMVGSKVGSRTTVGSKATVVGRATVVGPEVRRAARRWRRSPPFMIRTTDSSRWARPRWRVARRTTRTGSRRAPRRLPTPRSTRHRRARRAPSGPTSRPTQRLPPFAGVPRAPLPCGDRSRCATKTSSTATLSSHLSPLPCARRAHFSRILCVSLFHYSFYFEH